MNRGMHDNTDLINEFDFRVFRVFKFLRIAFNQKRASIGLLSCLSLPMLALFRLKTRTCSSSFEFELEKGIVCFVRFLFNAEAQRAQRSFGRAAAPRPPELKFENTILQLQLHTTTKNSAFSATLKLNKHERNKKMKDNKTTKLPSKLAKKLDDFMYYQNALESLKEGAANAECIVNKLENDILAEMANCDPSVFNCLLRKNIAAGISNGMIFKVSTRSSITRADGKSETDDKWLRSLPAAFVRTKLSLNKQAIEAAMSPDAENHLTASEMRKLGIARENAQSLKVYDEPSRDELTDLEKLAKVIDCD